MQRIATTVSEFTLSTAEVEVYSPPGVYLETSVTLVNDGPEIIDVRLPGQTVLLPVSPGHGWKTNVAGSVYARARTGTSKLIVAFGVEPVTFGVSSTDALSVSEVAVMAEMRTQKQLLVEQLLELRKIERQLSHLTDETVTAQDIRGSDLVAGV